MKHVRIQSFSFKPSTAASYPHGVMACSSTLTDMALRTHVNVLKDENHRSDTDVLCCLHQEQGLLYKLAAPLLITLDRRGFVNDIYFTDMAGNRLEGDYVPVSTAGPQLSDMETMFNSGNGNLKFFMDCDLASSYRKQDDSEASQGDTVKQWVARYPADESVAFTQSSVDGIVLPTFDNGSHVAAITTNPSGGAWESMTESDISFDLGSLFLLWETDSTPTMKPWCNRTTFSTSSSTTETCPTDLKTAVPNTP